MEWYLMAFKKYAEFSGRSRRKEFWMFFLFNIIALSLAAIIDNIIGTTFGSIPYGFVYVIYSLITFVANLSLSVRRLHDVGKSGWFLLIYFIPLIGFIWLIVLFCTDGEPGANKYGANPKNPSDELNEIGVTEF
jgi:uncharacterized membrane protein YhaH (DUF805 family)